MTKLDIGKYARQVIDFYAALAFKCYVLVKRFVFPARVRLLNDLPLPDQVFLCCPHVAAAVNCMHFKMVGWYALDNGEKVTNLVLCGPCVTKSFRLNLSSLEFSFGVRQHPVSEP
jgi:hypothetical protein